jgi:hypothetical protein
MVENQTERKVKVLRTDNGIEFCSNEFNFSAEKRALLDITPFRILHSRMVLQRE